MKIQLHNCFEEIIVVENLLAAWRQFVKGKRSKPDAQVFGRNLLDNLMELQVELREQRYVHGGYKRFVITDPKRRQIHKASVRDRVLHHAIYRVLYQQFDRTFIYDSYSCRVGKGTHAALKRFRVLAQRASDNHRRTCWVLQCDIKKFFDSIDQGVLRVILEQYIPDERAMWLLEEVIGSFSAEQEGKGLPLGNLTSQLLVNIYMNEFDQYLKHQLGVKSYIRYADDFVILSADRVWLESLIPRIERFLGEVLLLELHPAKVWIQSVASGIDFLGWVNFSDHRVLRTTTRKRMLRRIQERPEDGTVSSYLGLLKHGQTWILRENVIQRYWVWR